MHRRLFYWPVSYIPALIVLFSWILLIGFSEAAAADFFLNLFLLLFIGYFTYFSAPIFIPLIKGRRSTPTIWGTKEIGAREMYEFLKPSNFVSDHRIYSILTPVYATAFFILIIMYFYMFGVNGSGQPHDPFQKLLECALLVSGVIAYSSVLRFSALKRSETYPYFLAKAYLILSQQAENSTIRLRGFFDGLESYNTFLQRNFKIKITDPQSFYSRLASEPLNEQHETIKKISQSFHLGGQDIDELAPLREIKKSVETVYEKDFLTGARTKRKVEDWLQLLGVAVPLLVALVGLLFPR
jgi:hypothetical protein